MSTLSPWRVTPLIVDSGRGGWSLHLDEVDTGWKVAEVELHHKAGHRSVWIGDCYVYLLESMRWRCVVVKPRPWTLTDALAAIASLSPNLPPVPPDTLNALLAAARKADLNVDTLVFSPRPPFRIQTGAP